MLCLVRSGINLVHCLLQVVMDAVTQAVGKARELFNNDCLKWDNVIEAATDLVPRTDIERFTELCREEEHGLDWDEYDLVVNFNLALHCDEESEDGPGGWGENNEENPGFGGLGDDDDDNAREGFLAIHMWHGYMDWLSRRPDEMAQFKQFEVSPPNLNTLRLLRSSFFDY
jgi:hypothetical protein